MSNLCACAKTKNKALKIKMVIMQSVSHFHKMALISVGFYYLIGNTGVGQEKKRK